MIMAYLSTCDGVSVYYRDGGNASGPPVLYLHGGPGEGSADFEAFQDPYLRDTVRLVTLDQRGALRSPPVNGTITLDQLLADIEGLRTTLHIERWHVVGHSWGGWLASAYAGRYGDRVASVVLVCPALDWLDSIQSVVSRVAQMLAPHDPALAARVRQYQAELTVDQPIWPTLGAIWSSVPGPVINAVYNPGLDTRPYAQWLTMALQQGQFTDADRARAKAVCEQLDWTLFQASGVADIQAYTGPVLLLMGEADPVCTRRQQQAIAAGGGVTRWLPGGHKPFIECPEQFGGAVRAWVITHAEPPRTV